MTEVIKTLDFLILAGIAVLHVSMVLSSPYSYGILMLHNSLFS